MKRCSLVLMILLLLGCSDRKQGFGENNQYLVKKRLTQGANRSSPYKLRSYYNRKAYEIIKTNKNDSLNRELYFELAWNYFTVNDIIKFGKITNEVLLLSEKSNNKYHVAQSLNLLGIYYETNSINDSAFYYYLKTEKIYKELGLENKLCSIYRNKALVQYYVNDYLNAEKSLIDALIVAKKYNLVYEKFKIYSSLGIISYEQDDFDKASEYFNIAEKILLDNKSEFGKNDIAFSYCNKGINFFSQHQIDKSIIEFNKASKIKNLDIEYPENYSRVIDNLAKSLLTKQSYQTAFNLLSKSDQVRNKYNVVFGKNFNRLYLSYYYAALHDLPKANRYAQEALAISKSFKAPKDELMCLKQLIKINPKKALSYSSQYISLTDSMQKIERQSRNKFAKIAFETDEITKQKAAVEEQYTRIVWVCLIISVILILLFVIGKQLLKQKEFRLQHVQQQVNVEIYNLLLAQQNKIDNARNSEKERISKDLHDGVLNRLASTRMNLTGLISQPTADNIKKSRELIEGIQGVEKEIRNISHDLNKDILMKSVSFVNVITTYMEEQYEATQIKNFMEFDSKINWERFPGIVKIHLYRIVQESMQNIAKHAHASSIILSFLSVEGGVRVEIFDDGVGFLLNKKKKGIGLQNIYSRTASCNGTVLIESKKGIGTTIKVVVPYQD